MSIKNDSTTKTEHKEGALFGTPFLGQLPPRWAGRSPAFNDTFPSSSPAAGGQRWAAPGGGTGEGPAAGGAAQAGHGPRSGHGQV